ncbi:MAG: hypothetical protein ABIY48_03690 [Acidimicrobiales bacterium]
MTDSSTVLVEVIAEREAGTLLEHMVPARGPRSTSGRHQYPRSSRMMRWSKAVASIASRAAR